MQRIDGRDCSNLVTETALNISPGTSAVEYTSYDAGGAMMGHSATKSLFKQLQMNSEESISGEKEIGNVEIQTEEKEMQHGSQQISVEDAMCSPLFVEELNLNSSTMHGEEIQKHSSADRTNVLAQIEATVNSVLGKLFQIYEAFLKYKALYRLYATNN